MTESLETEALVAELRRLDPLILREIVAQAAESVTLDTYILFSNIYMKSITKMLEAKLMPEVPEWVPES